MLQSHVSIFFFIEAALRFHLCLPGGSAVTTFSIYRWDFLSFNFNKQPWTLFSAYLSYKK